MKIKYDKPNDFFRFVKDAYYISVNKKKILENKKNLEPIISKKNLMSFVGYIILLFIMILFYIKTDFIYFKIMSYIILFFIFIILLSFLLIGIPFLYFYFKIRKKNLDGTLVINGEGITVETDEIRFVYKWNCISCVIISNYSIIIVLNSLCMMLPIDIKEKLISGIEKYSEIKIIDLTI